MGVVKSELGSVGVMICADGFAPGRAVSRALGLMGAKVILSPCAWAVDADHDQGREPYGGLWMENYAPVAKEFEACIVGVSNVGGLTDGPWKGRKCIGCSLVVGPGGEKVVMGPYGVDAETIVFVDISCS